MGRGADGSPIPTFQHGKKSAMEILADFFEELYIAF